MSEIVERLAVAEDQDVHKIVPCGGHVRPVSVNLCRTDIPVYRRAPPGHCMPVSRHAARRSSLATPSVVPLPQRQRRPINACRDARRDRRQLRRVRVRDDDAVDAPQRRQRHDRRAAVRLADERRADRRRSRRRRGRGAYTPATSPAGFFEKSRDRHAPHAVLARPSADPALAGGGGRRSPRTRRRPAADAAARAGSRADLAGPVDRRARWRPRGRSSGGSRRTAARSPARNRRAGAAGR